MAKILYLCMITLKVYLFCYISHKKKVKHEVVIFILCVIFIKVMGRVCAFSTHLFMQARLALLFHLLFL